MDTDKIRIAENIGTLRILRNYFFELWQLGYSELVYENKLLKDYFNTIPYKLIDLNDIKYRSIVVNLLFIIGQRQMEKQ